MLLDCRHPHIVQIIGACLDPKHNVCPKPCLARSFPSAIGIPRWSWHTCIMVMVCSTCNDGMLNTSHALLWLWPCWDGHGQALVLPQTTNIMSVMAS